MMKIAFQQEFSKESINQGKNTCHLRIRHLSDKLSSFKERSKAIPLSKFNKKYTEMAFLKFKTTWESTITMSLMSKVIKPLLPK